MTTNLAQMPAPELATGEYLTNSAGEIFDLSAIAKGKRDLQTAIANAIAEAANAEADAAIAGNDAANLADTPIALAAEALASGVLDKATLSSLYGATYGFKLKADGTPGKTPEGKGNSHRKRAILLSEAIIATDNTEAFMADCPTWAKGVEIADIIAKVERFRAGELSASVTYKELGELKDKPKVAPLHLNAKKLGELAATLEAEATQAAIREHPALREAYAMLFAGINALQIA